MKWLEKIASKSPLIECLTNEVTTNDVANCILAVGGSPVMGIAYEEIREFVTLGACLLINVGTLTKEREPAFRLALECASVMKKPIVLDPVGAGAARYRTEFVREILRDYSPAVIRGNASEIRALACGHGNTVGVDVGASDVVTENNLNEYLDMVGGLASTCKCTVAMSAPVDVISDGTSAYLCRNGVPWMSRVTGTGCALTGVMAVFAAVADGHYAEAMAVASALMGSAGEKAFARTSHLGLGSFRIALVDALSMMTDEILETESRLEKIRC